MITIKPLIHTPESIPQLAAIWHEVLGKIWVPHVSIEQMHQRLHEHLHEHTLPLTLVAFDQNKSIGMSSLRQTDGILPELTPWLGSLVVAPHYQNKGIGQQLIQATEAKAQALGFTALYLLTFDATLPTYYKRLGWKTISINTLHNHPVTVMQKKRMPYAMNDRALPHLIETQFDAIIFDFDGVILDSEPIHYEACCRVFSNIALPLSFEEYTAKYLGIADKEMFPQILSQKGYQLPADEIHAMINEKIGHYKHIINTCALLPTIQGIETFIAHTIQQTKKMAICSGSTHQEISTVLARLYPTILPSHFHTIVTTEQVQCGKPSPEGYLLAASRLGVDAKRCLVIEDSPHGIEAAKKAGMQVIALLTTHDKETLQYADHIVMNFSELYESNPI